MVQGRDRRVELGYQLALNCRKSVVYPEKNKNSRFNPTAVGNAAAGAEEAAAIAAASAETNISNHNTVKASA